MCNPAWAIAMTVISTSVSVYAGYAQGQAQEKAARAAAKHKAALARAQEAAAGKTADFLLKDAERSEKAAGETRRDSGKARLAYLRKGGAAIQGARASLASRGVYTEDNSALDELDLMAELQDSDYRTIYDQFEREALGYQQKGSDLVFQSEQIRKTGQQYGMNARFYDQQGYGSGGALNLAASLTSGIAQGFGTYSDLKASGAFNKTKKTKSPYATTGEGLW